MPPLPRRALLAAPAIALLARPAAAQDRVLDLAVGAPPTSMDPHYHTLTPNMALGQHVFDNLVHRAADARLVPGLAESWRLLDDATWEFRLRRGVTFHNGEPFTARDVAYTLDRVPRVANSPGSFGVYTRPVVAVEIPDPHTILLRTAAVHPLLPTDLSQVAILWHGLGEGVTTGDFNAGRAAIGTGPFRLLAYRSGDRAELARNDAYWGERPAWSRVNYRFIPNDGARTAALRAGDIAFIDAVPTGDIERLRAEPRLVLSEVTSLRTVYLRPDFRPQSPYVTAADGTPLARNPLLDRRVREALSIAINRRGIAERTMSGAAAPTGQFMPAGTYGHVPDLPTPPYDPARARALLAEAGYAEGFGLTLHASNDRYVNDAGVAQSVGQMWTRIGIRARVEASPYAAHAQRIARLDASMPLGGWANSAGEPSSGLRALLATRDLARGWGTSNRTAYSNPEFDAILARALATADDAAREALMQEATRVAARDVAWIPLHVQKNVWGMRQGLAHSPRADEMTLAQDVRPV